MHLSIRMSELYIYVYHGYFKAFCARVHKFLSEKVHFAFSSDYSIDPHTSDIINPDGPHVIPYGEGDLDGKETHHQWYFPEILKTTYQYRNSNPNPTAQVTWSYHTKSPAPSVITTPSNSRDFQIVMDLTHRDKKGESVVVVY